MHIRHLLRYTAFAYCITTLCYAIPARANNTSTHTHQTANSLETITVTGTRDEAKLEDVAASIGILDQQTIKDINAPHSSDLLNRIPGVFINQLGSTGQGTSAAIRQPITTNPVYLYLENGVPTRSPAFFNHNALYEVNLAQASGVEVTKGPGSALYGSDAIGGVVNVLTNAPISDEAPELTLEGGQFDWQRAQITGTHISSEHKLAARIDAIDSIGWRENNEFDRQSANVMWQTNAADFAVNTVYSYTAIDMNTGGTGLSETDYKHDPEKAGNLIGYRDVSAQRLSSAWKKSLNSGDVSFTPYVRSNRLEYLATWTLNTGRVVNGKLDSQDAHINSNGDDSYGLQLKFKRDIERMNNAFWISGVDVDYGNAYTEQTYIVRTDEDAGRYWLAYEKQNLIYDYKVNFTSVSPYLHAESDIGSRWRINAGVRYDNIRYDYDNHLSTVTDSTLRNRPADTRIYLDHLSPKLGLIFDISETLNAYASYRHGFRIPSESQLFRAGGTVDSTHLDAVKVDSYEIGLRGQLQSNINFNISVYEMPKKDDILTEVNETTGARTNANAGKTDHRGIEAGVDINILENLGIDIAYAYNEHTFDTWIENNQNVSNKFMPAAPRSFTNLRIHYAPYWLNGFRVEGEWFRQGSQYVNANNTIPYDGYTLLNLRASMQMNDSIHIYINLLNALNERYAESVSSFGNNQSFTPGKPRTLFVGTRVSF